VTAVITSEGAVLLSTKTSVPYCVMLVQNLEFSRTEVAALIFGTTGVGPAQFVVLSHTHTHTHTHMSFKNAVSYSDYISSVMDE